MNNDDNESKKHQIKMRTFCPNVPDFKKTYMYKETNRQTG